MAAGMVAAVHLPVDTGGDKTLRHARAEQQMVDAETGIAGRKSGALMARY